MMTAARVDSTSSKGDLAVIDTVNPYGGYATGNTESITDTDTDGAALAEPSIGPSDPVGPQARVVATELAARFQHDAIPLCAALYRRALSMAHNRADAEDLVQDTMMYAYAGFGSFRQGTNLNAWLHRILTNTYISSYRKRQRQPMQCPTEQITDWQLAATAAHSSRGLRSAEDEALDTLPDSRIKAAMAALPEQFRVTVYYADVEGLGYRQIAEIMNTARGTVMSRVHRGRRRLRLLLTDTAEDTTTTAGPPATFFRQVCLVNRRDGDEDSETAVGAGTPARRV
jgi:RNA polymerase sigma-70 factor (ECF subfamily)